MVPQFGSGLPGVSPCNFIEYLFWCGVVTIGGINKRLIKPYRKPPLCFAVLVDPRTSERTRRTLASFALRMPACCQDAAFTAPLRKLVHHEDDFMPPTGLGYRILQGAFCSKNHNIQIENGFARASSWQRTNRGRTDRSFNLCSKHFLAEIKHHHKRARAREVQPKLVVPKGIWDLQFKFYILFMFYSIYIYINIINVLYYILYLLYSLYFILYFILYFCMLFSLASVWFSVTTSVIQIEHR